MADYTEILDDEILPDSPGTSILFFRLRDNPEAIAEGAPDAPRVAVRALAPGGRSLPVLDVAAITWGAIINLDDVGEIGGWMAAGVTAGGGGTFQASLSDDNGSNWSAAATLATWPTTGSTSGLISINLMTGDFSFFNNTGTITLPTGPVNAVRFRTTGAGSGFIYQPLVEAGKP